MWQRQVKVNTSGVTQFVYLLLLSETFAAFPLGYLKSFTFSADALLPLLQLRELLSGRTEFPLHLLLPGFHHQHTLSQDADHLIALLHLVCTKTTEDLLCHSALISTPNPRVSRKEMVHPLAWSTCSPFKRAHLCSSVSILWRSCSQASRCLCWEADRVFSSFSRSLSSAISNWSSLLCRWTVEPVRSFKEHCDRSQGSETSQNTLERQIQRDY